MLLSPIDEYLLLLDRSGAPLYYRTFLPNDAEDFEQQTLPDGTVVYTATVGIFDPNGWTLGTDPRDGPAIQLTSATISSPRTRSTACSRRRRTR